jgi:hypothetical protein
MLLKTPKYKVFFHYLRIVKYFSARADVKRVEERAVALSLDFKK